MIVENNRTYTLNESLSLERVERADMFYFEHTDMKENRGNLSAVENLLVGTLCVPPLVVLCVAPTEYPIESSNT